MCRFQESERELEKKRGGESDREKFVQRFPLSNKQNVKIPRSDLETLAHESVLCTRFASSFLAGGG